MKCSILDNELISNLAESPQLLHLVRLSPDHGSLDDERGRSSTELEAVNRVEEHLVDLY